MSDNSWPSDTASDRDDEEGNEGGAKTRYVRLEDEDKWMMQYTYIHHHLHILIIISLINDLASYLFQMYSQGSMPNPEMRGPIKETLKCQIYKVGLHIHET